MLTNRDGAGTSRYGERLIAIGDCFDPVGHASSSLCHGRIGQAAWALFERGDGLVLSIDFPGESLRVVPVDSDSEKAAFDYFASSLYVAGKRVFGKMVGR